MAISDKRLIEHGFPCHQVGAETQRERGASSALPPLYFLHVWWARRPLTPSRAAVLASLLPADYPPDLFLRRLGIEKVVALVHGRPWTLTGSLLNLITVNEQGEEVLQVDDRVLRALERENRQRAENRELMARLKAKNPALSQDPVLLRWEEESQSLPEPGWGAGLKVERLPADPAWFKELMAMAGMVGLRVPNLYGYERAFASLIKPERNSFVIYDPTAGGGSIPFEALRLGYQVIANELNPVAVVILFATLDHPAKFGPNLINDIGKWGNLLLTELDKQISDYFPRVGPLPTSESIILRNHLEKCPEYFTQFNKEEVTT
ncbi:MAG: DUF1156 domain-containing protein, partial [Deltaproteobacteria bacterium]|nr:DUF1156 domain-containing protein [Deltaproteobacteria bacterium]